MGDLTTDEGRSRVVGVIHREGPLEYLVNNAGYGAGGIFAETDLESQQQQVDLHITATLALTRAALPAMIEHGRGFIINLSSLVSFAGHPAGMVYGASKAFLNIFSEGLQQEVAGQGIWMEAPAVVASSLEALNEDQVIVVPGEHNLAAARRRLQDSLKLLGG
ncbi:MAG: SDR family NAD(P)-dependent oxidoreductase [Haliea sp.]